MSQMNIRADLRSQAPSKTGTRRVYVRAPPPAPPAVAAPPLPAAPPRPPSPPLSYLTVQDAPMVAQSLRARMAYAEAPAARPLVISVAAPPPPPLPPPPFLDDGNRAAVEEQQQRQQQQEQEEEDSVFPPSQAWRPLPHHLSPEALWLRVREESKADADAEPLLASFLYSSVLGHRTFEQTLAFVLANKLASPTLLATQLKDVAEDAYAEDPSLVADAIADLQAVKDRDPACGSFTQALLHFKGYQAIQSHRVAHHLWRRGRRALALMLQSRVSEAFHVDVHPAAVLGRGVMLDHATGIVIGETCVIGDNVSMLHHVSLGGSGGGGGEGGEGARHPRVGHGALLGAGATVVGPVVLGAGVKVGAGSVVVTDLEAHSVAVGVPARVIKRNNVGGGGGGSGGGSGGISSSVDGGGSSSNSSGSSSGSSGRGNGGLTTRQRRVNVDVNDMDQTGGLLDYVI